MADFQPRRTKAVSHHLDSEISESRLTSQRLTLHIQSLALEVIIGILPHERQSPQKVLLDAQIDYLYTPCSESSPDNSCPPHQAEFLNYALICELLEQQMREERYELLESALLSLSQSLKSHFPQILSLWLKITKPDILAPTIVGASLEVRF